jgi:hypothetical protein
MRISDVSAVRRLRGTVMSLVVLFQPRQMLAFFSSWACIDSSKCWLAAVMLSLVSLSKRNEIGPTTFYMSVLESVFCCSAGCLESLRFLGNFSK